MKNYTPLNNCIIKEFILEDLYRYTVLALTPTKKGYTDTTFGQLASLTGDNVYTIKQFKKRLKESNFVKIETVQTDIKRNHYMFYEGTNYRMVTNKIITAKVSNKAKGLLIGTILQTLNNSNLCGYSKSKIIGNLKADKKLALRCFKELEEANLITITNEGIRVSLYMMVLTIPKKDESIKTLKKITNNGSLSKGRTSTMANYYILHPEKIKDVAKLAVYIETGVKDVVKKNPARCDLIVA